jgi:hypothetical protein
MNLPSRCLPSRMLAKCRASDSLVMPRAPGFRRGLATLQEKHLASITSGKASKTGEKPDPRPQHAVLSAFDLFSIGVGPSSSHTLGPWRAARIFLQSLKDVDLFQEVATLKVDLYGSLAATGRGHASPEAILMGFQDNDPETFDTDLVQPQYKAIQDTKTLILGGSRQITFNLEKDLIYHLDKSLPRHPNGMTFSVFSRTGDLLATNTYYSIGGGFVVNEASASGGENVFYKQIKKEEASPSRRGQSGASETAVSKASSSAPKTVTTEPPLLFWSAESLLDICRKENMTIAQVVWENERHYLSDAEIKRKLLKLWSVMDECIHKVSKDMTLHDRLTIAGRHF